MTDRERESERESVLTGCIKVVQYHTESLSDVISRIRRNLFIHKARIPARRFSSSTSQHFKMFLPFASNEGYSASGLRYQNDGVRVTHPLPHSEFTRIRERMCDLTLTLSHSPFAYYSYISSYSLLIIPSTVL